MKFVKSMLVFLCTCTLVATVSAGQVMSWVDEHGKRHYGDTVPAKYKDTAVAVDTTLKNTSMPEEGVAEKNKSTFDDIQRSNEKRKKSSNSSSKKLQDKKNQADDDKPAQKVLSRSECRDKYIHTKQLKPCFEKADAAGKNY